MKTHAAVLTALIALAVPAGPTHAADPADPAPTCDLVNSTISVTATPNPYYTELFTTYGNTSGAWSGADSTYSVPLKDDRTAWLFSDTFYGIVNPDGSRPLDTKFVNNSIVVQDGSDLTTITGGTAEEPDGIIGPIDQYTWHWIGDGILHPNGKNLYIGVLQFAKFEPYGLFDFGWSGNYIATVDTRTWELTALQPAPSEAGVQWASWYERIGAYTYIYGVADGGLVKSMHIARVNGHDLAAVHKWQYWDGTGWSRTETDSVAVMAGVANEYSVTPYQDGYLLVTQNTNEIFSNQVLGYVSCSPTGPFVKAFEILRMPEVGLFGSYGDPNVFAYNAHEHPDLRTDNTLLVTYNVNTFDNVVGVYADASIYRPRFYDVYLTVTPN